MQVLHQGPPTTYAMAAHPAPTHQVAWHTPTVLEQTPMVVAVAPTMPMAVAQPIPASQPQSSFPAFPQFTTAPQQYVAVSSAAVSQAMAQHAQAEAHQMSQMQNLMAQHAAYQAQQAQQAQQAADEAAAYRAGQEWSLRSGYAAAAAAQQQQPPPTAPNGHPNGHGGHY